LLQVLSNPRLVADDSLAESWTTEYDYEDEAKFPKKVICDTPIVQLPTSCTLEFDNETGSFDVITKNNQPTDDDQEALPRTPQDVQDEQVFLVKQLVYKNRSKYQGILKFLREQVKIIREMEKALDKKENIKLAISKAKKRLCVFDTDLNEDGLVNPPSAKRRKSSENNKSRNSDRKLDFFGNACISLQEEEEKGYRKAWEKVYKDLKNNYIEYGEDNDDSSNEDENTKPQLPKLSSLLTNLKNCRVWRKATNHTPL
jgi:hypothetical protein